MTKALIKSVIVNVVFFAASVDAAKGVRKENPNLRRSIANARTLAHSLPNVNAPKFRYLDNAESDDDDDYYDDDDDAIVDESTSNNLKPQSHLDNAKLNSADDYDDYYDDDESTDDKPTRDGPTYDEQIELGSDKSFMKLATTGMLWRSYDQRHNTASLYQKIVENATVPTSFEILEKVLEDNELGSWE